MNAIPTLFLFVVGVAVNYLLRKLLNQFRRKSKIVERIHRYFPFAEITFWLLFFFFAINIMFIGSDLSTYINYLLTTIIFILIYWYFLRDYVAGIQLKSRFTLATGKQLSTEHASGTISRLGLLYLQLKSVDNSERKIPYSQIDQKSIVVNFQEKDTSSNSFVISLSGKLSDEEAIRKISELIVNSPWSSYKSPPSIQVKEHDDGGKHYEVSCKTFGGNASKLLKERIERELN